MESWFPPFNHALLSATVVYFLWQEVKEMRSSGWTYLSSRTNVAQLLMYLSILGVFVPMKFGLIDAAFELQVGFGGFITLVLWMLSLQFLEVVQSASYLLPMIADLFGNILNFFILFAVLQVGFTLTYYQLFRRQDGDAAFNSVGQSFLTTFFVLFGQVPLGSLDVIANSTSA
ncbi:hypothetical protein ACHHYP_05770 [Achlya hypogyna]|uniref:Ion transport domain-containing protein n=1 Tax=Achlya hypogyna TaxID=1202772 RepID=A0A1V9YWZ1_ACHHY|nr:hypothetical protein ACHHYP_05770 [Achlya hypogyna]